MGALWSALFGSKERPIKGIVPRLKNLVRVHYRGIFGGLIPFIALFIYLILNKNNHKNTVAAMWIYMAILFLLQPVNIPVTGMVPIFLLPLTCSFSTDNVVKSYMNEGIALFIIGNMLLLLWNNSGLDRRLILWFLSAGDASQCSTTKLIMKCSVGGFFLSMVSNRLIICNIMMQYVSEVMTNFSNYTAKGGPNMDNVKIILNNVIQTSCAIGGIAIVHSSYCTLAFRAMFNQIVPENLIWPDIFNYLEYTIFAFPTALVMLIANMVYHVVLMRKACKGMTPALFRKFKDAFMAHKKNIPKKLTLHEILSIVFLILSLAAFFLRYSKYWSGWAESTIKSKVVGIRDATVAIIFVVLLHALPNGYRFAKLWLAKKKSKFGPLKPESAILWWRFVDKNITYGYIFVIGSGVALGLAIEHTKLYQDIHHGTLGQLLKQDEPVYFLLVCLITVILANIMSGVPAVVIFLPLIIHHMSILKIATPDPTLRTEETVKYNKVYLGSLAVGIGASCGFANPFLYTTAYFCHYTGKSPRRKMAIYGAGSALICCLVLWVCITFYASILWGKDYYVIPTGETTTAPADAAPPRLF